MVTPPQLVPMLENIFAEEIHPTIQSKPSLVQLEAFSSCPNTFELEEEIDPDVASLLVPVESDKAFPEPLHLQAK